MKRTPKKTNEKGAAVILALILIAVLSVMAVSMMFLSQSEGWSSANYRLMSQARDGAEAGLNAAGAFLTDSTKYTPPVADAADPLSGYVTTGATVTDAGGTQIGLTADPNVSTTTYHYPVAAKQTAFNTAITGGKGSLAADNTTVNYYSSARLLSMRAVNPTGAVVTSVVQSWEITGRGTVAGVQGADVEISAILDRDLTTTPPSSTSSVITTTTPHTVPEFAYAAFGVSSTCNPVGLSFQGNVSTNSYDSHSASHGGGACNPAQPLTATNCALQATTGGNVGTNGALAFTGGSANVGGSLSTPRTGVGSCAAGDAVNNAGLVDQGLVQLPTTLTYPTPPFPSAPIRNDSISNNASTCPSISGCLPYTKTSICTTVSGCTPANMNTAGSPCANTPACASAPGAASKDNLYLTPGSYGDLSGGSKTTIYLTAGTYNINSYSQGAQATIVVLSGPVVINVAGCVTANCGSTTPPYQAGSYEATPLDMTGGGFQNTGMDASQFEINYGGPGNVNAYGNSASAGIIYAPNATFTYGGTSDMYGAVIANSVNLAGNGAIHYDRNLANGATITYTTTSTSTSTTNVPATSNLTPNGYTLRQFTWKKF